MQKIQRINSNLHEIKINSSWISSFVTPIKINKKNVITIDKNDKITIKTQLLRSMRARSEWGEGSSITK